LREYLRYRSMYASRTSGYGKYLLNRSYVTNLDCATSCNLAGEVKETLVCCQPPCPSHAFATVHSDRTLSRRMITESSCGGRDWSLSIRSTSMDAI